MPHNENSARLDAAQAAHVPGMPITVTAEKFGVAYNSLRDRLKPPVKKSRRAIIQDVEVSPATPTPVTDRSEVLDALAKLQRGELDTASTLAELLEVMRPAHMVNDARYHIVDAAGNVLHETSDNAHTDAELIANYAKTLSVRRVW